jgi:hypothetical protein
VADIKTDLQEIWCGGVNCNNLAQDRIQWLVFIPPSSINTKLEQLSKKDSVPN